MKSIDQLYQTAVDKEAERVLNLSVDSVLKVDDYGTVEATISGNKIIIGYWHHKLSDKLHHIIFQADRKVFLFLNKKYLSGVKLDNNTLSKLTDKEIGNYD